MFFTQKQIAWLNKLGAEDWRGESSCVIHLRDICTNIFIEALQEEFKIEISTPWNIIVNEFGNNLEETFNNAIMRYKGKVHIANIVVGRLDEIVQKSEGKMQ